MRRPSWIVVAAVLAGFAWGEARADEAPPAQSAPAESAPAQQAAPSGPTSAINDEDYELLKLFAETLDQVERNYVENISRRELLEAAIQGVLAKLDPHSNYISPEDLDDFRTNVENEFGGIGIQIEMRRAGDLRIVSPLVGSPAYRAGLQAGDRILEIDGESTSKLTQTDDAVKLLKGPPGSSVTLTVVGRATGRRTKTVEREVIQVETVMGDRRGDDDAWDFMLDRESKIGYIRLTAFSRDTVRDLGRALKQLQDQGMRALVLDLRFNPGGLLTAAIGVSDLFVNDGKIVSTEGRNTAPRVWEAQKAGTFDGFPMVVLVNGYSASASEIVSACLQDHGRAVVLGERTWGKGSVQNVIELEGGKSALKLTTASYQRPNGKNIHRFPDSKESDDWGVSPSDGFEVKLGPEETSRLMIYRRDRDILRESHAPAAQQAKLDDETQAEDAPAVDAPAASEAEQGDAPEKADEAASDEAAPSDETTESTGDESDSGESTTDETNADETKSDESKEANDQDASAGDDKAAEQEPADANDPSPATEQPAPQAVEPASDEADADPHQADEGFVDRQLQRAIEHLLAELKKADAPQGE